MNADVIASAADIEPEPLLYKFVDRKEFAKAAEEWSRSIERLNRFEDEFLLVDNPPLEKVVQHKKAVEHVMLVGQLFTFVSQHPEFDDSETSGMISATHDILRDKLRMFHNPNPMRKEVAEQLLKEVFPGA
jgi:hypothetical protein